LSYVTFYPSLTLIVVQWQTSKQLIFKGTFEICSSTLEITRVRLNYVSYHIHICHTYLYELDFTICIKTARYVEFFPTSDQQKVNIDLLSVFLVNIKFWYLIVIVFMYKIC